MRSTTMLCVLGLLAAVLAGGAAGCGEEARTSGAASGGDSPNILMISSPPGDDFYYTIEESAKREAERVGADLEIQKYSKYEAAAQVAVLNAAIAKRPDAILVGPIDENALQAPLERAANRGIKIVTYDTNTREPDGVVSTYVASDIVELGRSAARAELELISRRGKVFYQGTQPDNVFFDSLRTGWSEVMDKESGVEQLPVVYSDWEPSKSTSQMQTLLTAHPDLRGGFGGIVYDQQGIVPALKRAGKLGRVKVVGVDGAPANVQRLRAGELSAIVSVNAADYGVAAVRAAVKAIKGEKLPPKTVIGQCVLEAKTIDDPENKACLYEKATAS